jgi:hypothetical protein
MRLRSSPRVGWRRSRPTRSRGWPCRCSCTSCTSCTTRYRNLGESGLLGVRPAPLSLLKVPNLTKMRAPAKPGANQSTVVPREFDPTIERPFVLHNPANCHMQTCIFRGFISTALAVLIAIGISQPAAAQPRGINFDDLGASLGLGANIPNGYSGLSWNIGGALMGWMSNGNTNYTDIVCRSASNCAYNGFGLTTGLVSTTPITLTGWMDLTRFGGHPA